MYAMTCSCGMVGQAAASMASTFARNQQSIRSAASVLSNSGTRGSRSAIAGT